METYRKIFIRALEAGKTIAQARAIAKRVCKILNK